MGKTFVVVVVAFAVLWIAKAQIQKRSLASSIETKLAKEVGPTASCKAVLERRFDECFADTWSRFGKDDPLFETRLRSCLGGACFGR